MSSSKRIGGTLVNWRLIPVLFSEAMEPKQCIAGEVIGDDLWEDGMVIRSSVIENIDEEEGWVATRNTIYALGDRSYEKV